MAGTFAGTLAFLMISDSIIVFCMEKVGTYNDFLIEEKVECFVLIKSGKRSLKFVRILLAALTSVLFITVKYESLYGISVSGPGPPEYATLSRRVYFSM